MTYVLLQAITCSISKIKKVRKGMLIRKKGRVCNTHHHADSSTQTLVLPSPPLQNTTFDWSEEPIDEVQPMFPPPPKYEPWDLSVL
jgi:hypothetical protein